MKKLILLSLCLFSFILISNASAAVSTIPSCTANQCYISEDSNLIVYSTTGSASRIEWRFIDGLTGIDSARGLLPKFGTKNACYFSSDDMSTCGPTPLTVSNEFGYDLMSRTVTVSNPNPSEDSQTIIPSALKISPDIDVIGNTLIMRVPYYTSGGTVSSITYNVYDSNLDSEGTQGSMTRNTNIVSFEANVTLETGTHYIEFKATSSETTRGGYVKAVIVGSEEAETVYDVVADIAKASITAPQTGASATKGGFKIKNNGITDVTDLSVVIAEDYENILEIILGDTEIESGGEIGYTVKVKDITTCTSVFTTADLMSGDAKVGEIDVELTADIIGSGTTSITCDVEAPLTITPTAEITGDYFVSTDVSEVFTLENDGDDALTLEYVTSTSLTGMVTITGMPDELESGESVDITVNIDGDFTVPVAGTISVITNEGNKAIVVNVNFYDDFTSDIARARSELLGLQSVYGSTVIYGEINSLLGSAESNSGSGVKRYGVAEDNLNEARAKMEALQNVASLIGTGTPGPTPPAEPIDFTWIIIAVVIIAVAAAGVYIYFTKVAKKEGGEDEEEIYDEEGFE